MDPPDPDPISLEIHRFLVLAYSHFIDHPTTYILFTVLFTQMLTILLVLFDTEFREPLIVGFDGLKTPRAQLVVKSVSATMLVIIMYNIYSVLEIRFRSVDAVNSPFLAYRIQEASLMGFSLFLLLVINNMNEYIKEIVIITNNIRDSSKQSYVYEICKIKSSDEAEFITKNILKLKTRITELESEYDSKEKILQHKKANSSTLKDRFEGLIGGYDRLLAHNEDIRDQLREINEKSSQLIVEDDVGDQLSDVNEKMCEPSVKKTGFFSLDRWGL